MLRLKRLQNLLLRRREIFLHGGLGDIVALAPLIKREKAAHPRQKLVVLYRDEASAGNPETLSYDTARHMTDAHGKRINFRREYLETFSFIDELRGADPKRVSAEYWHPAEVARRAGGLADPAEYRELLEELFTEQDKTFASRFWVEHGLDKRFVIAIHFRRSSAVLYRLYQAILGCGVMGDRVRVLAMGSTEHEKIPALDETKTISLVDSYQQGIGLRPLLAIGRKANLFLGGRGGFEHFFWYAQVPSINFFDAVGFQEIEKGFWNPALWKENPVAESLLHVDKADVVRVFETMILPQFHNWQMRNAPQG